MNAEPPSGESTAPPRGRSRVLLLAVGGVLYVGIAAATAYFLYDFGTGRPFATAEIEAAPPEEPPPSEDRAEEPPDEPPPGDAPVVVVEDPVDPPVDDVPPADLGPGDVAADDASPGEVFRVDGLPRRIASLSVSPDGTRVAGACWDGTARIWDLKTAEELHRYHYREKPIIGAPAVCSIDWTADGGLVMGSQQWPEQAPERSGFDDFVDREAPASLKAMMNIANAMSATSQFTVRTWQPDGDKRGGEQYDFHMTVTAVAASPVANVHAAGLGLLEDESRNASGIVLWDGETRSTIGFLDGHRKRIHDLDFSPDGRLLASASHDGTVVVWDVRTGAGIEFDDHDGPVLGVAFADDSHVVTAGDDRTVRIWNWRTDDTRVLRGHTHTVASVDVSPDGRRILTGGLDLTVRLWDFESGEELCQFIGHEDPVWSVAFHPDGRHALSGGGGKETVRRTSTDRLAGRVGLDNALVYWRLPDGPLPADERRIDRMKTVTGSRLVAEMSDSVSNLVVAADGRTVVGADAGGNVKAWDLETGRVQTEFDTGGKPVVALDVSPDYVAAVSNSGAIRVWDREANALKHRLIASQRTRAVRFGSGGSLLSADHQSVWTWDPETGMQSSKREVESGGSKLSITTDSRWIVAGTHRSALLGGAFGDAHVWDVRTGTRKSLVQRVEHPVTNLATSADSRYAAVVMHKAIDLVSIPDGINHRRAVHKTHPVTAVAFSPDGRFLVSGDEAGMAHLWTVPDLEEFGRLVGRAQLAAVAVTPDGRTVITGSTDGSVHAWTMPAVPERTPLGRFTRRVLAGHSGTVFDVGFLSEDEVISIDANRLTRMARVWNLDTGDQVRQFETPRADGAQVSPSGKYVVTSDGSTYTVQDSATGETLGGVSGRAIKVFDLGDPIFSVDDTSTLFPGTFGERVGFTLGETGSTRGAKRVVDPELATLLGGRPEFVGLSNDRSTVLLAVHSRSGRPPGLVLWRDGGDPVELRAHETEIRAVNVTGDGSRGVSIDRDGVLIVWDLEAGKPLFETPSDGLPLSILAVSADGSRAATANTGRVIRVWNVTTGEVEREFRGHEDHVTGLAFSPSGRQLASSGRDHTVRVWKVKE